MFKRPQKADSAFSFSDQTRIALWGPSGVGKDWLFHGFAKELEFYNSQDREFHYEISEFRPGEPEPTPISTELPATGPTPGYEDHSYTFRRIPLVRDTAHEISAQAHELVIHNDKGANLIDSLNDRITFETTFQTLLNAQNILLVLGLPREDLAPVRNAPPPVQSEPDNFGAISDEQFSSLNVGGALHSSEASRSDWSRVEYRQFMELLLASLGSTPRRNLAVCMTKSDQLNFRGSSWEILQRRYGDALRRLLEVHRQRHDIEVFTTSAAGYLRQSGKVVPNFENSYLRDQDRWNPVNTAAPFFWIFEKIEQGRLQRGPKLLRRGNIKNYIPYPTPRSF